MSKIAALEEMFLIYWGFREYLAYFVLSSEHRPRNLKAVYQPFCQREPIGVMFIEAVQEELLDHSSAS